MSAADPLDLSTKSLAPVEAITHGTDRWVDRLTGGWRPYLISALVLLACALPGLIMLQPLDRDEARFVQATAQMFESGDFIRISFQDEPRNKKPVGIHWLQAIPVALAGGPDDRIVQLNRLVSLLGALLAVWATVWTGKRLGGPRLGLLAGGTLAASLILSTEAGIAKTDAMLAATIALAFMGLAALRGGEPKRWGAALFWSALACGIMIKGPVAAIVILPSILLLSLWERTVSWMKPLADWRWIGLFMLIAVPWHVAIWVATDGAFFRDAIGEDLAPKLAGTSENDPVMPGAYLLASPLLIWPGSVLLAAAFWAAWRFRAEPQVRFLVAWLVPGWLVFELAPAKLIHYTLPVHAPLIMLGVIGILAGGWQRGWVRWIGIVAFVLGGLVLAAAPSLLADEVNAADRVTPAIFGMVMGIALLMAATISAMRKAPATVAVAAAAVITSICVKALYLPSVPQLDISRQVSRALMAEGLHPRLTPPAEGRTERPPLIGAGYQEPSLIWATRTDSALMSVPVAAAAAMAGSPVAVTADQKDALVTALAPRMLSVRWTGRTVNGVNYSKGDPVEIVIGVVEATAVSSPPPQLPETR
ncbi:MAG: glycosyltransferase family 39 protein [Hyphomonadaceae bacterium]|nr:glycosyltransferase family 39 protein [Hyphomonadaceae bacterium]